MKNKVVVLSVLWLVWQALAGQAHAQISDEFDGYRRDYDRQVEHFMYKQYDEISHWFEEAYQEYPSIPRGMLEAVAFQYTRFSPNISTDILESDPTEMPRIYSVMGLTLHGKGVFRENARLLARTTPYSLDAILWQPGTAVKAYACAFAQLQERFNCYGDSVEQYKRIFIELCELPIPEEGTDDFALNSFLYMIYYFLDKDEYAGCGAPLREIDFVGLFGDEYARLRGGRTEVAPANSLGMTRTTPDYPDAVFVPAAACNYTSGRGGTTVSSVTIHYTQGTYAGSIAWFQNCSAKVSAHYVIRSIDGQVTQMVREADKAWHVGVANSYTIGIEHEAYGNIYSYFTMNMYQSSANLVKNICSRRPNINPHRVFYRDTLDDGTVLNYGVHSLGSSTACTQIRGHQHYPSQTHTDPGPYWNWNLYYKLINDQPTVTTMTASSGTFTDSGGPFGNYADDERKLFLIQAPGADSVALTFQSFSLEPNYDFLWIYEGGTVFSPLIGRWNTQSPGRVVAAGDKMLVEFRSDCATNAAGWNALWQGVSAMPGDNPGDTGDGEDDDDWGDDEEIINDWEPDPGEPVADNASPQTAILTDATQWVTGNFTAQFNDSDDSGLKWRFYQIMESDGSVWSARHEQGFLCDNFDNALNGETWVNNVASTWAVQNGELRQNNAALEYAGIAAHHNGAAHSAYLYDFYLKFLDGERCSFFFNCGNAPSQTSLFSGYEVCFDRENRTVSVYRLILGAKRLLKRKEQVYFAPGTAYLCRVVFDHSTGEIVVMRHGNRIVRAVDQVLATTTNSYIGFATRNAAVCIDNLRVYASRTTAVPVTVGTAANCNIQRQAVNGLSRTKLKSIVVDRAYKFSTLVEKSLKVDYTAPPAVSNLSLHTESVTQADGTQVVEVSATWTGGTDAQSGLQRYYFHNSKMLTSASIAHWVDNGLSCSCQQCFSFPSGQMITFSVVTENKAGLRSTPKTLFLAPPTLDEKKIGKELLHVFSVQGKRLVIHCEEDLFPANDDIGRFVLYDMAGRVQKEGTFNASVSVDAKDLSCGVYLLRVTRGMECLKTEKIVLFE